MKEVRTYKRRLIRITAEANENAICNPSLCTFELCVCTTGTPSQCHIIRSLATCASHLRRSFYRHSKRSLSRQLQPRQMWWLACRLTWLDGHSGALRVRKRTSLNNKSSSVFLAEMPLMSALWCVLVVHGVCATVYRALCRSSYSIRSTIQVKSRLKSSYT